MDEGSELRAIVEQCRRTARFLDELRTILASASRAMEAMGSRCMGGGCCCKFDLAGFRLFVSCGELSLLTGVDAPPGRNLTLGRCPYQVGPSCRAYAARPLGCRTHYCREAQPDAASRTYEAAHAAIRDLHARYCIPYRYVDIIAALTAIDSRVVSP